MEFKNTPNKSYKTTCGKEIWKGRNVAVVITILAEWENENYVLILKRGPAVNAEVGKWCMPCGYLDWDESGNQAAVREVWEETGLDVQNLKDVEVLFRIDNTTWKVVSTPDDDPRQNVCLHYGVAFRCRSLPVPSFENCEAGEVEEFSWVKVKDVGSMDLAFNHQVYPPQFELLINAYKEIGQIKRS